MICVKFTAFCDLRGLASPSRFTRSLATHQAEGLWKFLAPQESCLRASYPTSIRPAIIERVKADDPTFKNLWWAPKGTVSQFTCWIVLQRFYYYYCGYYYYYFWFTSPSHVFSQDVPALFCFMRRLSASLEKCFELPKVIVFLARSLTAGL